MSVLTEGWWGFRQEMVRLGLSGIALCFSVGYLCLGWAADGPGWLARWWGVTRDLYSGIWGD